jgi:hypothetical protein
LIQKARTSGLFHLLVTVKAASVLRADPAHALRLLSQVGEKV